MAKVTLDQLEGGPALCTWFGGSPSFHDAALTELELRQGAPGRLVAHTFQMGSEVDTEGQFLLKKHVTVTLNIFDLIEVQLSDFAETGIMYSLEIEKDSEGTILNFDSSYGVCGRIKAKRIVVSFEPGKPA